MGDGASVKSKKSSPFFISEAITFCTPLSFTTNDTHEVIRRHRQIKDKFPKDWDLPNVYLLHGSLSTEEMNKLYNHPKVKAFVSFTHGEVFGRPLLEASMVGLPVIASAWSGQTDFLSQTDSMLIGGELVNVPKSQHWKHIVIPE